MMRNNIVFVISLISILSSCSNDLDISAPADPVPVVYFRMNPADSIYYLTLTKTFSGTGSGFDLARDPDHVYFDHADICLEGWANRYKVWETQFNLLGTSKYPGIFPENSGYCFGSLNEFYPLHQYGSLGHNYDEITTFRLKIEFEGALAPVLSTISLIPMPKCTYPTRPLKVLDLYPNGTNYKATIQFDPQFVKYCELICVFRYQELEEGWIDHSTTFQLHKDVQIVNDQATAIIDPDLFFTKVAHNIQPVNVATVRKFKSLDFIFLAGDQNFDDYYNSYINSGNVDAPPVGNINNGLGLFTMVRSLYIEKNMTMNYRTLDYLSGSEYTQHLGFIRW